MAANTGKATAATAKPKNGPNTGIELNYSRQIQTNGNVYTIEIMVVVRENGVLVKDAPIMYRDENLNIVIPKLVDKGFGRVFNFITKGNPGGKVKLSFTSEINGKAFQNDLEIDLPKTPNVKATKITLGASEPWFTDTDGKIRIMYYATVTDGINVIEGVEVEFFGDAKNYTQEAQDNGYSNITDKNGKAHFEYIRDAYKAFGKTKTMRVKIAGTDKEDKKTIKIFPDPGTGATQRRNSRHINKHLKKSEFTRHLITTTMFVFPTLLALMILPNYAMALFGLAVGFFVGGYMNGLTRRLVMSVGVALFMYLTASLHVSVIIWSAALILLSEVVYWLEGINYLVTYETNSVAKTVHWKKWINFYPWCPIFFLLCLLFIDVLLLGTNSIISILPGNEVEAFKEGIVYYSWKFEEEPNYGFLQLIKSYFFSFSWQINIIGVTTLTAITLLFRGAWGEIKDAIQSRKGEYTFSDLVKEIFTIKEITDILGFIRRTS